MIPRTHSKVVVLQLSLALPSCDPGATMARHVASPKLSTVSTSNSSIKVQPQVSSQRLCLCRVILSSQMNPVRCTRTKRPGRLTVRSNACSLPQACAAGLVNTTAEEAWKSAQRFASAFLQCVWGSSGGDLQFALNCLIPRFSSRCVGRRRKPARQWLSF